MKLRVFLVCCLCLKFARTLHHQPSVVQVKEEPGPGGAWRERVEWKAHWVKHWEVRKVWINVWKKVWGPVQLKEWIPFPKPPPPSWAPPPH